MTEKSRSLGITDALAKLRDKTEVIARRGKLTNPELKRVPEAVAALRNSESNNVYEEFLRKVFEVAGSQMVILCVVGLGRTAVKGMRDRVRVDLPFEIKSQAFSWENSVIQDAVDRFLQPSSLDYAETNEQPLESSTTEGMIPHSSESTKTAQLPSDTLTGYMCNLSVADAQAIMVSGQTDGPVRLTYPYDSGSTPSITIPITMECARLYLERQQMV